MNVHQGTLPAPLVPPEVDLTDFGFMPLDILRLKRSKSWLIAKRRPELVFYWFNLWTASWHSLPAGSLDDDEEVLADLAKCSSARWPRLRDDILRGWVKCSDFRLYHPVVCEKVLEAWKKKLEQRERTEAARRARDAKRRGKTTSEGSVTDTVTETVTDIATDNVTGSKGQGQGQGDSVGGGVAHAREAAAEPNADPSTEIVAAFHRLRDELWPNNPNFPEPPLTSKATAQRWLEMPGATVPLITEIIDRRMRTAARQGKTATHSLKAMDDPVTDAIAGHRSRQPDPSRAGDTRQTYSEAATEFVTQMRGGKTEDPVE